MKVSHPSNKRGISIISMSSLVSLPLQQNQHYHQQWWCKYLWKDKKLMFISQFFPSLISNSFDFSHHFVNLFLCWTEGRTNRQTTGRWGRIESDAGKDSLTDEIVILFFVCTAQQSACVANVRLLLLAISPKSGLSARNIEWFRNGLVWLAAFDIPCVNVFVIKLHVYIIFPPDVFSRLLCFATRLL